MSSPSLNDSELRREIDRLGRLFGEVLREFEGAASFDLVELVRRLAGQFRDGDAGAADALRELLATLSEAQLSVVVRAFSAFLELANLAEDRQRIRVLRARELQADPGPRPESLRDALRLCKERGLPSDEVERLLNQTRVELVLTAHPTEAKRRSLRQKTRRIADLLAQLDARDLLPRERDELWRAIRVELIKLWQTDFIRDTKPTVFEEAQRGLAVLPVLWQTTPTIYRELRDAAAEYYPEVSCAGLHPLRFGSWIGGDRDGNPYVTPEVTAQVFEWMRKGSVEAHLATCEGLIDSLSLSSRAAHRPEALRTALQSARERWLDVAALLLHSTKQEPYRDWLEVIRWRLQQTGEMKLSGVSPVGAYASGAELKRDLEVIAVALRESGNEAILREEIAPWLTRVEVFGIHGARLDIRQHTSVYREAIVELLQSAGRCSDPSKLTEPQFQQLLAGMLDAPFSVPPWRISPSTAETLSLFTVIRRVARRFGMEAIGGHVLSMTHLPSDLFTVLWLWKWSERVDGGCSGDEELLLPIIPLFETIDDLHQAASVLEKSLQAPAYREYLRKQDNQLTVMIGYSDSTKDGGYLAAIWALQRAQVELYAVAKRHGVSVTFFHGRGGSLGRGGGPTARSIQSLPRESFSGALRLTEQGEVLAERYDDPQIAHRHLEQVVGSVLMAIAQKPVAENPHWQRAMESMSGAAYAAYRELVEAPSFAEFFRTATPIRAIEELPIGSRPAKRKVSSRIEDLRAIPWVFAWTQCRCLLPAWYGLGSAIEAQLRGGGVSLQDLRTMHREWPLVSALLDNAVLALAKSNMAVFREYAELASEIPDAPLIAEKIVQEYQQTQEALLSILDERELLDRVPWLKRSIQVRNGYVDPLNFVQMELLRRWGSVVSKPDTRKKDDVWRLTGLAVKGIAAGMRTTG